ncbi:MAG TPA: SIS domain-containing protein [Pseudonocardiaceae bacterium]|nr:SIS domain-containing protein [Pseudonocardiaceae bacterium]
MSGLPTQAATAAELFERRVAPLYRLAEDASTIAIACHAMAVRFHRKGTLVVFGNGTASTDAQHVVVEFVHPVIMGKRALPAISLTADVATVTGIAGTEGFDEVFAHQLRHLASARDIALGISPDGNCTNVLRGLATARELGMLTVALVGGDGGQVSSLQGADHIVIAHSDDPQVIKEVHVTAYHVLWELVHVFFQHPDLLEPRAVA